MTDADLRALAEEFQRDGIVTVLIADFSSLLDRVQRLEKAMPREDARAILMKIRQYFDDCSYGSWDDNAVAMLDRLLAATTWGVE